MPAKPNIGRPRGPAKERLTTRVLLPSKAYIMKHKPRVGNNEGRVVDALVEHAKKTKFHP